MMMRPSFVLLLLSLAAARLACSEALVPSAGLARTRQGHAFDRPGVCATGRISMSNAGSTPIASVQETAVTGGDRSRAQFLRQLHAGVSTAGVATAGWGVNFVPAQADSTGKYSTKATARRRFLPRIVNVVSAFQQLKKDIASGSVTSKSDFFVEVLPDGQLAMELFGSSFKRGETPDSISRGLQQLAKDFGTTCQSIAKSLDKGSPDEAAKAYDKASTILANYLQGTKLDPMGSDAYK